ncbi:PEP-CTERM sorting domain-containing protein [Rubellicoccus peritrichatus]|uniref:PEP-CTERM sorting domain-containing protein n=1 Tax=Rubellicoccus peritrichatus TaxID=3080537 RepID=A0AAQ3QU52_9BACT|nr:PEP-CTERM sorting domain-containing protein [Puniceicoccus sp. CR14]WOO42046.1 PEP-CTERM sorting domain-containing protein [Puniceicoccus sp. CR14]
MKKLQLIATLTSFVSFITAPTAFGADVNLTANDAFGTSSFNAAGNWSDAAAPSAGNDYFVTGFLLRTPEANADITFGGDSLTINAGGRLINKVISSTAVVTINNLTLNGGLIDTGLGSTLVSRYGGNFTVNGTGSQFDANGTPMVVSAVLSGTGDLEVLSDPFGITFSAANTYTGNFTVNGPSTFSDTSSWSFDIGANGVNNSIGGGGTLNLDGSLNLDLSGAGTGVGDSWLLVDNSSLTETYGGTFTVAGFSDDGGGLWSQSANGVIYQFDQGTGALSVSAIPEPSVYGLLIAMGVGFLAFRRRKMNA